MIRELNLSARFPTEISEHIFAKVRNFQQRLRSNASGVNGVRSEVKSAGLTLCRSLPVCADGRTSSDCPGRSGWCQFQTHAEQQMVKLIDHLVGLGKQRWWHGET